MAPTLRYPRQKAAGLAGDAAVKLQRQEFRGKLGGRDVQVAHQLVFGEGAGTKAVQDLSLIHI